MIPVSLYLTAKMTSCDLSEDGSDPWDFVQSDVDSSEWHFVPAVAKSRIGTSNILPAPAPLLMPPPQPKKGYYELPRAQPLGIPKFRPPGHSTVAKPLSISSPVTPSVLMQGKLKSSESHLGSSPVGLPAAVDQTFPAQRDKPANPTVSTRTRYPSQCAQLIKLFVHCISQISALCNLHAVIVDSRHPTLHFHQVLDQFAASTVWRYLSIWQQFYDALPDMDLQLERLTEVELADVVVSLSLCHKSDSSTGAASTSAIKAVRWMTKVAYISCLKDIVYGSIISSYLRSRIPRERRAAVPLALFIVLQCCSGKGGSYEQDARCGT